MTVILYISLKSECEVKMKKYPYTETTDMVIYSTPKKKEKKPKIWLAALTSALAASVFTAGVCSAGFYYISRNHSAIPSLQTAASAGTAELAAVSGNVTQTVEQTVNRTILGKTALTIPEIAEKVGPSVVGVINKTTVQAERFWNPFDGRYYYSSDPSQDGETIEQGSGSGIIISEDGYIVTNQHVVDGASEISVILNTGEEYTATLIGQDTKTDLAVLKIEADVSLTAATLGNSSDIQVGELAVAIGNPMGIEFSGSVTAGIVSAVNRTMTIDDRTYNLIQTDAAINGGNSGGALINQYGEVIGINSVKLSSTGVEGMGFAIAIDEAKPVIDDLMSAGYVTGRPLVGITIQPTRYGLFIDSVQEGSGAAAAGLKAGDQILSVDDKNVSSTNEINEIRDTKKPGDTMKFRIVRSGNIMEINVTLSENSQKN